LSLSPGTTGGINLKVPIVTGFLKVFSPYTDDWATYKKSIATLMVRVAGALIALVFNIAVARLLGASATGTFFLGLAIIVVASTVSRFGMDTALLKIVGREFSNYDFSGIKGLFHGSAALGLYIGIAAAVVLHQGSSLIAAAFSGDAALAEVLRHLAPAVPLLTLLNIQAACFFGIHRTGTAFVLQNTLVPLLATLGLIVSLGARDVVTVSIIYVLSVAFSCLIGAVNWGRSVGPAASTASFAYLPELFRLAPPMLLTALMNRVLVRWSAIIFLGLWSTTVQVGLYAVAARLTLVLGFALTVANAIAAPRMSTHFAAGNKVMLMRTTGQAANVAVILSAPAFLIFLLFPQWTMSIFGDDFRNAGMLLFILSLGEFVNVMTGPVGVLLQMSRHERAYRDCAIVGGALQILLCVVLIPPFGAIGAAVATAVSMATSNLCAVAVSYFRLGILPIPLLAIRRPDRDQ
jgi:O-antigen/teichoic acid export membrane protein